MENTGNDKEFLGITQNECSFQGQVVGDPVIQSDNYAFMQLKTVITEIGANGQYADVPIQVPIICMDPKKVAVIQKYVQDGRRLHVSTYYKPWVNNGQPQHAFMLKQLKLGRKKWVPRDQQAPQTPQLPVS